MLCTTIDELIIICSLMCILCYIKHFAKTKKNFGKSILKSTFIIHINP
jgi:hypothetical protein